MDSQHLREIAGVLEKCAADNNPGSLMAHAAKLRAMAEEQGYQNEYPSGMTFEAALYAIKNGNRVKRAAWGPVWIEIHRPPLLAGDEKMTRSYIYMRDSVGYFPWVPSQADLLASDWSVVR